MDLDFSYYNIDQNNIDCSHYVINLNDTGVTQLTIFSEGITSLELGDEIGVFDLRGIKNYNNCNNDIGELLVGKGFWDGTQLNIVSIGSIDYCSIGSFQLSGFVNGNDVVVKVWRQSTSQEYNTEIIWSGGDGTFGDVLQQISEIQINLTLSESMIDLQWE